MKYLVYVLLICVCNCVIFVSPCHGVKIKGIKSLHCFNFLTHNAPTYKFI